jgi:hypothetical protein
MVDQTQHQEHGKWQQDIDQVTVDKHGERPTVTRAGHKVKQAYG